MKVSIVGAGYIGATLAAVLCEKGAKVVAIDTNSTLVNLMQTGKCPISEPGLSELINQGIALGRLSFTTDYEMIADTDVVLITVGTPLGDDGSPDTSQLQMACHKMSGFVNSKQTVIVKSTVPPGVTRDVVGNNLRQNCGVAISFSPERLAEGNAINELNRLPIIVGGIDEFSRKQAANFWKEFLEVEIIEVSSLETAEMVKLADNLWIDLNIALANDLARVVDALPYSIDVIEIIKGANTLPKGANYVNILTPSNGVGGYCLTKDPIFVDWLASEHDLEIYTPKASRAANDVMPTYCAEQILKWIDDSRSSRSDVKIGILGFSFKSNSGDLRFTPVLPLIHEMVRQGIENIEIFDPMVDRIEAEKYNVNLNESIENTISGADVVVFTVAHDSIASITIEKIHSLMSSSGLIFDGRRYFSRAEIYEIESKGLAYIGVGR